MEKQKNEAPILPQFYFVFGMIALFALLLILFLIGLSILSFFINLDEYKSLIFFSLVVTCQIFLLSLSTGFMAHDPHHYFSLNLEKKNNEIEIVSFAVYLSLVPFIIFTEDTRKELILLIFLVVSFLNIVCFSILKYYKKFCEVHPAS